MKYYTATRPVLPYTIVKQKPKKKTLNEKKCPGA